MIAELVFGCAGVAFIIFEVAGMWKTFEKGNYPGLFCLIPFYNVYVMTMLAGLNPWVLLFFLVPGVNALLIFFIQFKLARKFQFDPLASVLMSVLGWLILFPIIGFGKSVYEGAESRTSQMMENSFEE